AEAEVYSVADDPSACRRGFDVARELVPPGDEAVDPGMPFIILNSSHLARWQGNAFARLGDPDAVEYLYQAIDGNGAVTTRAKAGLHCDLAAAHLQRGERGDAAEHASRARRLARQAGSIRQQRRVDKLLIVG